MVKERQTIDGRVKNKTKINDRVSNRKQEQMTMKFEAGSKMDRKTKNII